MQQEAAQRRGWLCGQGTFLSIFVARSTRLRGGQHIVEPFRSDLKLQVIDKLRDEADQRAEPVSFRKLRIVSCGNRINTIEQGWWSGEPFESACSLTFETLGNLDRRCANTRIENRLRSSKRRRLRSEIPEIRNWSNGASSR